MSCNYKKGCDCVSDRDVDLHQQVLLVVAFTAFRCDFQNKFEH
jgi:hypothetical protein